LDAAQGQLARTTDGRAAPSIALLRPRRCYPRLSRFDGVGRERLPPVDLLLHAPRQHGGPAGMATDARQSKRSSRRTHRRGRAPSRPSRCQPSSFRRCSGPNATCCRSRPNSSSADDMGMPQQDPHGDNAGRRGLGVAPGR
jgi:hypothetical protein